MAFKFSSRMESVPESFLGRLFEVSNAPGVISFAGGLPSSSFIDVAGIEAAALGVFKEEGAEALQYSTTDGYLPLRRWIADRYRSRLDIPATPEEIQIVNGSQQCLDLMAKIFLDRGDVVGIERPGYLGAIEAFSLYQPVFCGVPMEEDGPDTDALGRAISESTMKFFYAIPNSQNPSGRSYSIDKRKAVAECLEGTGTVLYEDDAFGELFFDGMPRTPIRSYLPGQAVLSGSFSKVVAPGMRIGWIYAPAEILARFNIVKQAADLHSNFLCQRILHRYLEACDFDRHLREVSSRYGERCRLMCDLFDDIFPPGVTHTIPEGGMFMMAFLPPGLSAMALFEAGIGAGVAVLPGVPFFVGGGGDDCIRLNFSSAGEDEIQEGMTRLASVMHSFC
jgi:2-aminoadipate transaminase